MTDVLELADWFDNDANRERGRAYMNDHQVTSLGDAIAVCATMAHVHRGKLGPRSAPRLEAVGGGR